MTDTALRKRQEVPSPWVTMTLRPPWLSRPPHVRRTCAGSSCPPRARSGAISTTPDLLQQLQNACRIRKVASSREVRNTLAVWGSGVRVPSAPPRVIRAFRHPSKGPDPSWWQFWWQFSASSSATRPTQMVRREALNPVLASVFAWSAGRMTPTLRMSSPRGSREVMNSSAVRASHTWFASIDGPY